MTMTDAEHEELELRGLLAEADARHEVRAELDRRDRERILADAKWELAQDKLDAEIAELDIYRAEVRVRVAGAKTVAPQLIEFIDGSTRAEIDRTAALAVQKTSEILAEIAGQQQGEQAVQARDERTGAFIPAERAGQIDLTNISFEDWAKVRGQFIKQTDRGLFQ
jgi:hypothetical protein